MSVRILVKIDQELRPWECLQTDRQTDWQIHWQTQTDFIICPMLCAIAMKQITRYTTYTKLTGHWISARIPHVSDAPLQYTHARSHTRSACFSHFRKH